jgi:hypothetical protein
MTTFRRNDKRCAQHTLPGMDSRKDAESAKGRAVSRSVLLCVLGGLGESQSGFWPKIGQLGLFAGVEAGITGRTRCEGWSRSW